jgi:hypothetical protein
MKLPYLRLHNICVTRIRASIYSRVQVIFQLSLIPNFCSLRNVDHHLVLFMWAEVKRYIMSLGFQTSIQILDT